MFERFKSDLEICSEITSRLFVMFVNLEVYGCAVLDNHHCGELFGHWMPISAHGIPHIELMFYITSSV